MITNQSVSHKSEAKSNMLSALTCTGHITRAHVTWDLSEGWYTDKACYNAVFYRDKQGWQLRRFEETKSVQTDASRDNETNGESDTSWLCSTTWEIHTAKDKCQAGDSITWRLIDHRLRKA